MFKVPHKGQIACPLGLDFVEKLAALPGAGEREVS